MKKFIIIVISICLIFTLASCEKKKNDSNSKAEVNELYAAEEISFDFKSETDLLKKYPKFSNGEAVQFKYDFNAPEYKELLAKYPITKIAGEGSEFKRAMRLVDEYAPRLTHESNYDNHVEENSLDLLKYSLDNPKKGINCRAKSKILNEMCLALGIYSRRVFISPYSSMDSDSHVVNEIYDTVLNKWIMIDMTTDAYFADENGTPLSILEIRQRAIEDEYLAMIKQNEKIDVENDSADSITYYMKNIFFFYLYEKQGYGTKGFDDGMVYFQPEGFDVKKFTISRMENRLGLLKMNYANEETINSMEKDLKHMKKSEFKIGSTDSLIAK